MILRFVFLSFFILSCSTVEERFSFKEIVVTDTRWKLKAIVANAKDCEASGNTEKEHKGGKNDKSFFKPLKEANEPVAFVYDHACVEDRLMEKIKTIAKEELCKNGKVDRVFLCKRLAFELSSQHGLECYVECGN